MKRKIVQTAAAPDSRDEFEMHYAIDEEGQIWFTIQPATTDRSPLVPPPSLPDNPEDPA